MSLAERVGQLFMTATPATRADPAAIALIRQYHVGSIILQGRSTLGVAQTAQITGSLQANASPKLFIAADQEGGQIQALQGPGFSAIPSAVDQGMMSPTVLRTLAGQWGSQLRQAGVNLDLAPVADTVPDPSNNPPIGGYDRQYGSTPAAVAPHVSAFVQGMQGAGVDACAKHFPGLGRVTANTDFATGVLDTVTTRNDPFLAPFDAAVSANVAFVMMSTAVYTKIAPQRPAAFSPFIVTGMLRGDLHFRGVVISDDVGGAAQVSGFTPSQRALDFIAAGGDVVLTVDQSDIPTMVNAVIARASTDRGFAAIVNTAALSVLEAKSARGLL